MQNILFKNKDLLETLLLPYLLYKEQQLIFVNKFLSKLNYDLKCKHFGLHGVIEKYNPHGILIEKKTYSDNVLNGEYQTWYYTGIQATHKHYVDGKSHGPYISWYDTGQMCMQANFKNSMTDGEIKVWYRDGRRVGQLFIPNGEMYNICKMSNNKEPNIFEYIINKSKQLLHWIMFSSKVVPKDNYSFTEDEIYNSYAHTFFDDVAE